jgi:hypothetical protein
MALGPNNAGLDPYDVSKMKLSWDTTTKVCSLSLLRVGVVIFNLTLLFFSSKK